MGAGVGSRNAVTSVLEHGLYSPHVNMQGLIGLIRPHFLSMAAPLGLAAYENSTGLSSLSSPLGRNTFLPGGPATSLSVSIGLIFGILVTRTVRHRRRRQCNAALLDTSSLFLLWDRTFSRMRLVVGLIVVCQLPNP